MPGLRIMFRRECIAVSVLGALLFLLSAAHAQAPGLGPQAELVDPHVFRACVDPRNMPFSNKNGDGFEDKLAELLASKLHEPASFTYFPQVIGFYRNTIDLDRCDVVMGVAQGYELVQTTNPYYRTTYALIFKPHSGLDGVDSLEDPRLKDKRIGVVAGTPPASLMVQNGLMAKAKPYPLTVDTRFDSPSKAMMDDLIAGRIDAGVLWGPIAGYYAKNASVPLTIAPLLKEQGVQMVFPISLGVRHSDQDWKRKLNQLLADNQPEINKLLASFGVPLLDQRGHLLPP
jgi:quinoprotein dehydrogenase-associated probable ABC transporter substrate-binding protein